MRTSKFSRDLCVSLLLAAAILYPVLAFGAVGGGARYQNERDLARLQSEIEKQKPRLNSGEVEERRDAVMRLGALRWVDASRAVLPALSDVSPIVRVAAAVAVSFLPADESIPVLIPLFNDKDPFVRQEVAYALGAVRSPRSVAALVERLSADKENGVRGAAAVALGMIGDEAAVVALAQLLSTAARKQKTKENVFVLRAAAQALGEIKSRAAVPALIDALSNESLDNDIRREAAHSLGLIGDPSASSALRAATSGNDPHLSRIAFAALQNIEPTAPKKPL